MANDKRTCSTCKYRVNNIEQAPGGLFCTKLHKWIGNGNPFASLASNDCQEWQQGEPTETDINELISPIL